NTNDFGLRVENWATTASWGNRRGYLNQPSSSMFSEGAYDPLRERSFQTVRAADGKHFIAHLDTRGTCELQWRATAARHFQQHQIICLVACQNGFYCHLLRLPGNLNPPF